MDVADYVAEKLSSGELEMSCEDPDAPENWPRNMFVWRSNLLGSSGKGHEYYMKHLLGTRHGVQGKDLGEEGGEIPQEVVWHEQAPEEIGRASCRERVEVGEGGGWCMVEA